MIKIGRNEPCWCESGKKYKNCHLNRKSESALPFGAVRESITKASDYETCMYHEASKSNCGRIIKAHTLQRARVLRSIESKDHHVMTFYPMDFDHDGEIKLHRKGWKRASTFKAFCEVHDGEVFGALEKSEFTASRKQVFLIAYRAVCWELYQKERGMRSAETMSTLLDRGRDPIEQKYIQRDLKIRNEGMLKGHSDVLRIKTEMDEDLKKNAFQDYRVSRFRFSGDTSVVATGAITPNTTISGESIQLLHDPNTEIEWLPFGVDIDETGFSIVFLWKTEASASTKYMKDIMELSDLELTSFLPQFFFAHCENTYFSESWWHHLERDDKVYLTQLMRETNPYYFAPKYDFSRVFTNWKLVARETK